ncbi:ATP-binding protein [Acidovorax sp.]|uniref:ATP-binding protein n=1 Tax=Acidovorax sp. TaxID=1872122 RepID=UPI0027BAC26C|nr:ATP-binding protein [Acidovorax sp.]
MTPSRLTSSDTAVLGDVTGAEAARAVAAFLNSSGGRVLLGIDDSGRVLGINSIFEPEDLSRRLRSEISPPPRFSITTRVVSGKTIALVDVPTGSERPYVVDDMIFVWRGGQLASASPLEISEMIVSRSSEAARWERQPAPGIDIDDLDEREIDITYGANLERSSNRKVRYGGGWTQFLEDLGVANSGQLLNSAVVLFARRNYIIQQAKVKIAAFQSLDKSEFIENKLLVGNLFDLFEQVTSFLDRHVSVRSSFELMTRKDVMAIPPFVIREAVMNALVHRDYSQANANITVALYPDRLEIWNPGSLPDGLSADSLARTHVSRPTNPDIANVAFLRGLVEQWGSGTGRIVAECRKMGLEDPEWKSIGGGIQLTIPLVLADGPLSRDVNERMRSFLLETYPGQVIAFEDYTTNWASLVSERTARRDLDELVELGFVLIKGTRPYTYVRSDKLL